MTESAWIILFAVLIDLCIPEPSNRFHPVAFMGRYIGFWRDRSPASGSFRQLVSGLLIVISGGVLFSLIGWGVEIACLSVHSLLGIGIQALVLKLTFSLRSLWLAGRSVLCELRSDDLSVAQHWLGWHLVSRSTENLNASEVAGAAIESITENLTDSFVAPLCCYLAGGLPAAFAYRYLNTCDAMIGYRNDRYEWLGKVAARADDLLNYFPARLATLCLWGSVVLINGHVRQALRVWWQDRAKTSSPNAGQTMSLVAGGLGVRLEKQGTYKLGSDLRPPTIEDLQRSLLLFSISAGMFLASICAASLFWGVSE